MLVSVAPVSVVASPLESAGAVEVPGSVVLVLVLALLVLALLVLDSVVVEALVSATDPLELPVDSDPPVASEGSLHAGICVSPSASESRDAPRSMDRIGHDGRDPSNGSRVDSASSIPYGHRDQGGFMDIRTGSVLFPALRGSGPRTASQTVVFPRNVARAAVGLSGYSAGFSGDDHHFGNFQVSLSRTFSANTVTVTATLGVRDWSGTWDDNYEGTIRFVVLAELDSPSAPPRRADMAIIDAELNQAIQFFRSDRHLDPANVRPDNSIRLLARKPTGVRLYIDYDASASPSPVASMSGELRIRASAGASTVIAPTAAITPMRESNINRGVASHTLNFVIPEAWSQGQVDIECEVFDAGSPTARSPVFARTIQFVDVAPLRVFCVGFQYTGQGLNVAAPVQTDFASTLAWIEKTYPVGEALITGYASTMFSRDMKVSGDGCGDGWNGILDALRDMRGGSDDIYVGLLAGGSGIDSSIDGGSSSVVGCGGGGVAAAFTGDGATLAQEIGHAFGRDHAPCDDPMGRCDNPSDQDGSYPDYGTYSSDSIGEYGYDPATDTVFDPASTYDFMGYSSGDMWVSPYTYTGLMGKFPASSGLSSPAARRAMRLLATQEIPRPRRPQGPLEVKPGMRPHLFFRLSIDRERKVELEPSFHFDALDRAAPRTKPSGFRIELLDDHGNVLVCRDIGTDCFHCGPSCWPKRFVGQVPFPPSSRRVVVREGDTVVFEHLIEEAPHVKARVERRDAEVVLRWDADKGGDDLTFLPQWLDRNGVWRGLAPRTRAHELAIAKGHAALRRATRIRVLATRRVATGAAEIGITAEAKPEGEIQIEVRGDLLYGSVASAGGGTDEGAELAWYDEHGAEIGTGRMLDLRALPQRPSIVRVAAYNEEARVAAASVQLDHDAEPRVCGVFPDHVVRSTHPDKHPGKPDHHH